MPVYETLLYEVRDNILTLTLNRPEQLNSFTGRMALEMIDAFDQADADDEVKAIVVTGAGRAFCAGADLSQGGKTFDYEARKDERPDKVGNPVRPDGTIDWSHQAVRDGGGTVTLRIFESLKPVIAAINGPAVGIGATMLLPMDIRLAADNARIGFVFARRGITPEACSSWFLPRVVGVSRALEWTMTGRVMSAQEALQGGLVRELFPPDQLLASAYKLAREIIDNSAPVSVALARQMMWKMLGADHPMEAHKIDSRAIYARGRSSDVREGVTAFLEKRPAAFSDKVTANMPEWFPWWEPRPYK